MISILRQPIYIILNNSLSATSLRGLKFSAIQDCQQYLSYCSKNSINTGSTVFRGTLYELHVKAFFEKYLNCENLIKNGGAYDNGVDIIGKWNLSPFYNEREREYEYDTKPIKLSSKSILKYSQESKFNIASNPISLINDIQVLIQCKNVKKKPDAKIIRELSGILDFHKFNKKSTFMFIVTPYPCTPQAVVQLDTTNHAIIHFMISPLTNNSVKITRNQDNDDNDNDYSGDSFFNLDSWKGGDLKLVYMNRQARKLLSGLNMEQKLKLILFID